MIHSRQYFPTRVTLAFVSSTPIPTPADTPDIKTLYISTTGCSLHKRLNEHQTAIARQDKSNALAKHMMTNHQNQTADFCTKIVDEQKFNLQRFVSESLYIENCP